MLVGYVRLNRYHQEQHADADQHRRGYALTQATLCSLRRVGIDDLVQLGHVEIRQASEDFGADGRFPDFLLTSGPAWRPSRFPARLILVAPSLAAFVDRHSMIL
jgi:hypothetical protein